MSSRCGAYDFTASRAWSVPLHHAFGTPASSAACACCQISLRQNSCRHMRHATCSCKRLPSIVENGSPAIVWQVAWHSASADHAGGARAMRRRQRRFLLKLNPDIREALRQPCSLLKPLSIRVNGILQMTAAKLHCCGVHDGNKAPPQHPPMLALHPHDGPAAHTLRHLPPRAIRPADRLPRGVSRTTAACSCCRQLRAGL